MKRETPAAGCSACDRGSGRAPGKRIQQRHSGKEVEFAGCFGDKAQLDNRIQGLGGAKQTTNSQRRKDDDAGLPGYSDAVIVTRVEGWVGSGPRVVSPAPSARDAMPRFGHSGAQRRGRQAGSPPPTPNHDRLGRVALNRRLHPSIRAPTGVREKYSGRFWPVVCCFFSSSLHCPIQFECVLAWKRFNGSWDATRAQGSWTLRINFFCGRHVPCQSDRRLVATAAGFPSFSNAGVALNAFIASTWSSTTTGKRSNRRRLFLSPIGLKSPLNPISNSGHPLIPIVQHNTAPPRGWLCSRNAGLHLECSTPKDWVSSLWALMHTPWRSPRRLSP